MYLPRAIRRFYWLVRSMDLLFGPRPELRSIRARKSMKCELAQPGAVRRVLLGAVVGIHDSLSYSAAVLLLVCAAIFATR